MNVAELIAELQKYDPSRKVIYQVPYDDGYERWEEVGEIVDLGDMGIELSYSY